MHKIPLLGLFPFDPSIDTKLGHRNLIAIYIVVWTVQLAYGLYALRTYRSSSARTRKP